MIVTVDIGLSLFLKNKSTFIKELIETCIFGYFDIIKTFFWQY
jgi:hypothetical protein